LALVPVIFLTCLFIGGVLWSIDDVPRWVGGLILIATFVGPTIALVVSVVAALRLISSARREGIAAPAGSEPATGLYEGLARRDAESRGLTREEYGVYKGDVGSAVTPVNSASGLLVLSIILTVIEIGVVVLAGVVIAQNAGLIDRHPDDMALGPVEWFFFGVSLLAPVASWHYYRVERRAQKLRVSRGLPRNIP
jgi:hypothetical protein